MTYEEAIKWLGKQPHHFSTIEEAELDQECRAIINEALEKQIPKKPRRTNGGLHIAKKDFYTKCQLCNHNIPVVVRDGRMRFCPFCGQAIDWSDEE